jgi:hypothetical protein
MALQSDTVRSGIGAVANVVANFRQQQQPSFQPQYTPGQTNFVSSATASTTGTGTSSPAPGAGSPTTRSEFPGLAPKLREAAKEAMQRLGGPMGFFPLLGGAWEILAPVQAPLAQAINTELASVPPARRATAATAQLVSDYWDKLLAKSKFAGEAKAKARDAAALENCMRAEVHEAIERVIKVVLESPAPAFGRALRAALVRASGGFVRTLRANGVAEADVPALLALLADDVAGPVEQAAGGNPMVGSMLRAQLPNLMGQWAAEDAAAGAAPAAAAAASSGAGAPAPARPAAGSAAAARAASDDDLDAMLDEALGDGATGSAAAVTPAASVPARSPAAATPATQQPQQQPPLPGGDLSALRDALRDVEGLPPSAATDILGMVRRAHE